MQSSARRDLPSGLLGGRLEGISLPDLMWAICRQRATGVLAVERNRIRKTVYVADGGIVFATSSDPNERLGEMLLRCGTIGLDQLEEALGQLPTGKRLGTLLVQAGHLSPDQLVTAVVQQVKGIVLDLLTWEEGHYSFDEGALPTQEVITLQMKTNELLLAGIRNIHSFTRIRRSVGAPRTVYALGETSTAVSEGLALTEGEQLLLDRLRGGEDSIENLCRDVLLSNFEIYQALWALKVLGVVRETDRRVEVGPSGRGGRLERSGFAEALIRFAGSGEVGVLSVSRGAVERTFHLREGRCVFATSSNPDDGLVAYLLRCGVISLRDREETARRLLSNKRVGAILRDMGVLEDGELHEMVRQHLCEIVYDTFTWEQGEYVFAAGPLPTAEEITLDRSLAALAAEGLRRVRSWTRVIKGCGGLDTPLALTPHYLDVLDAMNAGADEWHVINTLRTPQSPRRICRLAMLPDFRVCQILWTLRLLGALVETSVEQQEEAAALVDTRAVPSSVITVEEAPAPADEPSPAVVFDAPIAATPSLQSGAATMRLSRAEVESALGAGTAEVSEPAAEPPIEAVEAQPTPTATPDPQPEPIPQLDPIVELEPESMPLPIPEPMRAMPDFEPPDDLDATIARFNVMHRLVYRAVRSEVGAGAVNFVRSCCWQLGADDACSGAELHADGAWDAASLRQAAIGLRLDDPARAYQRLIETELALLRTHVGDAKVGELKRRLLEVDPENMAHP